MLKTPQVWVAESETDVKLFNKTHDCSSVCLSGWISAFRKDRKEKPSSSDERDTDVQVHSKEMFYWLIWFSCNV